MPSPIGEECEEILPCQTQEVEGTTLAMPTNGSWRATLRSQAALALAALALGLLALVGGEDVVKFRSNTLWDQQLDAGCSRDHTGHTGLGIRRRALADIPAGSRSCRSRRAVGIGHRVGIAGIVAAVVVVPRLQPQLPQQTSPSPRLRVWRPSCESSLAWALLLHQRWESQPKRY